MTDPVTGKVDEDKLLPGLCDHNGLEPLYPIYQQGSLWGACGEGRLGCPTRGVNSVVAKSETWGGLPRVGQRRFGWQGSIFDEDRCHGHHLRAVLGVALYRTTIVGVVRGESEVRSAPCSPEHGRSALGFGGYHVFPPPSVASRPQLELETWNIVEIQASSRAPIFGRTPG